MTRPAPPATPAPAWREKIALLQHTEWQRRETITREMLGRWVSELEPSLCIRQGTHEIIGLSAAGHGNPVIFPRRRTP